MTMTESKCPWCGGRAAAGRPRVAHVWWAVCANLDCCAVGPTRPTEAEALAAFCAAKVERHVPCPGCGRLAVADGPARPEDVCTHCCTPAELAALPYVRRIVRRGVRDGL